jgi:hypothetical protein
MLQHVAPLKFNGFYKLLEPDIVCELFAYLHYFIYISLYKLIKPM